MFTIKQKFITYLKIQRSGATNMLDIKYVRYIAKYRHKIPLTKDDCLYIIKNYPTLKSMYHDEWERIFGRSRK